MYSRSFQCLNSKIYARNAQSEPFNFETLENLYIFKIAFYGRLTISWSILTLHSPILFKQLEIISGFCRTSPILVTMSTWGVMSYQTVPIFTPQTLYHLSIFQHSSPILSKLFIKCILNISIKSSLKSITGVQ